MISQVNRFYQTANRSGILIELFVMLVSEAPKEAPVAKKYDSTRELEEYKSDEQKKEMVSLVILLSFLRIPNSSSIESTLSCKIVGTLIFKKTLTLNFLHVKYQMSQLILQLSVDLPFAITFSFLAQVDTIEIGAEKFKSKCQQQQNN